MKPNRIYCYTHDRCALISNVSIKYHDICVITTKVVSINEMSHLIMSFTPHAITAVSRTFLQSSPPLRPMYYPDICSKINRHCTDTHSCCRSLRALAFDSANSMMRCCFSCFSGLPAGGTTIPFWACSTCCDWYISSRVWFKSLISCGRNCLNGLQVYTVLAGTE